MNPSKAIIILLFCAILSSIFSGVSAAQKISGVDGVMLGQTKQQVIKALGDPESPLNCDLYFKRGKSQIIVSFNDKTGLAELIVVIGYNPKFTIAGINAGSVKSMVKKAYGAPEKVVKYMKGIAECWYYPTKNINFSFDGDKVSSFGVGSCSVN